jgi:hypothetical protein
VRTPTDVVWLAAHVDMGPTSDPFTTRLAVLIALDRLQRLAERLRHVRGVAVQQVVDFPHVSLHFVTRASHSYAPLSSSPILTLQAPRAECWIRVRASAVLGWFQ